MIKHDESGDLSMEPHGCQVKIEECKVLPNAIFDTSVCVKYETCFISLWHNGYSARLRIHCPLAFKDMGSIPAPGTQLQMKN